MKNFIFPQIFKPVIEENSFNTTISQWHMTSRRIQTQIQLSNDNQNAIKSIKKTQHNLLLYTSKCTINRSEDRQQYKIKTERQNNLINNQFNYKPNIDDDHFNKHQLNKLEQIKSIKNNDRNSKQKKRIYKMNTLNYQNNKKNNQQILQKLGANHNQNISYKNNFKNARYASYKNQQKQKQNKKEINKTDRSTKILNNTIKPKVTFNINKPIQKQENFRQKSNKSIQRSNKYLMQRSDKIIQSQKATQQKIQNKHQQKKNQRRQRRRLGVQKYKSLQQDCEVKFETQNLLKKSIKKSNIQQNTLKEHIVLQQHSSFNNLNQSLKLFNKSRRNIYKNKTFHTIQNSQKQIRFYKRSYTVRFIQDESVNIQCKQDDNTDLVESKNQKNQIEQSKKQKSRKKRVHFGRTSIEDKTQQFLKQQNRIPQVSKSKIQMKLKRLPKRLKQSECQSIDVQSDKSCKIKINSNTQMRKGGKIQRYDTQNVYNQLNYFRMRLTLKKKQPDILDTQNLQRNPQAILYSVDKIKQQPEKQRIQRTKFHNQMIDFGVKITRDCLLKQIGAKKTIICYPI